MSDSNKIGDKELAAISATVVIFAGLSLHWVSEIISTVELIELAYGSFSFFNNPLVF
ncbi:MAG: hypothetical protein AB8B95_11880 [Pseudohongiellaceae bacterium]